MLFGIFHTKKQNVDPFADVEEEQGVNNTNYLRELEQHGTNWKSYSSFSFYIKFNFPSDK